MTQSNLQSRQSEKGFTLVELAIVMIIIGLLIGGILKGQELIANARVSSTASAARAIESGVSAFRDKFGGMPGDIITPENRIANCPAAALCGVDGNADGRVQTGTANNPGAASTAAQEAGVAFTQLGAAGMVGGINGSATALANGTSHPTTPIGGIWNFGYSDGATAATAAAGASALQAGHYVVAANTAGAVAAATTVPFQPVQSANIDRKIDDGSPNTGTVRAIGTVGGAAANCVSANTDAATYNENNNSVVCGLFIKVQ